MDSLRCSLFGDFLSVYDLWSRLWRVARLLDQQQILDDQSKFKRLGPASSNFNTANIKSRLQKRLFDLVKADVMMKWAYDAIRPIVSRRPRMYGLPKTLKESTPLSPILSMTSSSYYELGKWLASLLGYNLCWSGFCDIAHQIRPRLLRPCKIWTSTPMSSCVLLMYPACSPTFPLMKPPKSVWKPSMASLFPDQSFQRTCSLN